MNNEVTWANGNTDEQQWMFIKKVIEQEYRQPAEYVLSNDPLAIISYDADQNVIMASDLPDELKSKVIKAMQQQDDVMANNREKFAQDKRVEESLRLYIRSILDQKVNNKLKKVNEQRMEKEIRSIVRSQILEAKKNPTPQSTTGANVLGETLRRIVPIIKDAFFSLTSNVEQRRSFRAHIINGFRNALSPYIALQDRPTGQDDGDYENVAGVDSGPDATEKEFGLLTDPSQMNEIEVNVGNDKAKNAMQGDQIDDNDNGIPDAEENFIEVEPEKQKETAPDPEKEEKDKFGIPGEDSTGRNVALQAFKKIEKAITDDYSLLDNKKDREVFYEYGIINLKLYFDRWEEELQINIREK